MPARGGWACSQLWASIRVKRHLSVIMAGWLKHIWGAESWREGGRVTHKERLSYKEL